jgi:hypothetical protein
MSAGDLTPVELLRTAVCYTHSWPQHQAEVYKIGKVTLMICQHCGRHCALSPWDLNQLDKNDPTC